MGSRKKRPGPGVQRTPTCRTCGSAIVTERRPVRGQVFPAVLLLAGSVLTNFLVGFVLIAAGVVYTSRRRDVLVCPACGPRPS